MVVTSVMIMAFCGAIEQMDFDSTIIVGYGSTIYTRKRFVI